MADPIRATIDLDALSSNIKSIREKIGESVKLLCVLKADAYGHGATEITKHLKRFGVDYVGVATIEEALEIHQNSSMDNILIFNILIGKDLETALKNNLILTVGDREGLKEVLSIARNNGKRATIHFKVDTGMGRLGVDPETAYGVLKDYGTSNHILIEGVYSHFAASGNTNKEYTLEQLSSFKKLIKKLSDIGINPRFCHMANSGAILDLKESHFNMVRPGILIYGYFPSSKNTRAIRIKPIMTFSSAIIFVKKMKKGDFISYGLTYMLQEDSFIASVRAGYGDGYPRALSNRGEVIINGKLYPVVGTVCMDQILIKLGRDYYKPGERVTLFGQKDVTAETIAQLIGTIPYEILCNVNKRVPRYYDGGFNNGCE